MTVAYQLTASKYGRNEFRTVANCIQTTLKQTDQVLRRVTTNANSFKIVSTEFFLADRTVITFQFLLGAQLDTIVSWLATVCTVLAWACSIAPLSTAASTWATALR